MFDLPSFSCTSSSLDPQGHISREEEGGEVVDSFTKLGCLSGLLQAWFSCLDLK